MMRCVSKVDVGERMLMLSVNIGCLAVVRYVDVMLRSRSHVV